MAILDSPYNLWSLLRSQPEHPGGSSPRGWVRAEAAPQWSDTLRRRDGSLSAPGKSKRASAVPALHVRPALTASPGVTCTAIRRPWRSAARQRQPAPSAAVIAGNGTTNRSGVFYWLLSRNKAGWAKRIFVFSFWFLHPYIRGSFSHLNKYKWHECGSSACRRISAGCDVKLPTGCCLEQLLGHRCHQHRVQGANLRVQSTVTVRNPGPAGQRLAALQVTNHILKWRRW